MLHSSKFSGAWAGAWRCPGLPDGRPLHFITLILPVIVCRRFHAHSVWHGCLLELISTAHWSFSFSSSSRGLLPHLSFSVASLLFWRQAAEAWPRAGGPGARAGLALPPLFSSKPPPAGAWPQMPSPPPGWHAQALRRSIPGAGQLPFTGIGRTGDGREHLFDR